MTDRGGIALWLLMVGVLLGLLRITDWSVGWDDWPAFVALPVALAVVGAWHHIRKH